MYPWVILASLGNISYVFLKDEIRIKNHPLVSDG